MEPDGLTLPPSGIAVPIRLPPRLATLRRRHDLAAAAGARPHVTTLYPFMPCDTLTPGDRSALAAIASTVEPFEVRFEAVRRFDDGVVWIEPLPAEPFRALTAAVVARWPTHPPYGGLFDEVIPHLTIAEAAAGALPAIEAETASALPVVAHAERLEVWCQDERGAWRPHWRLRLGRPRTEASVRGGVDSGPAPPMPARAGPATRPWDGRAR